MDPKETKIPAVLLAVGIAIYVVLGFCVGGAGGAGVVLVGTLLGLVIGIPLGIIACFITAGLMGASFGTLKGAILKLGAIYTFPAAVLLVAASAFSMGGVLVGLLLGIVLYWGLLAWLFELDTLEVIVLAIVLWAVRLGASHAAELAAARLFLGEEEKPTRSPAAMKWEGKAGSIPSRGAGLTKPPANFIGPTLVPKGKLSYVDLQSKANRKLAETLAGDPSNTLADLPKGEQTLAGVRFRIDDGFIQLAGTRLTNAPDKAEGIPVRKWFTRLYILHATQWGGGPEDLVPAGTLIGSYWLHYQDGSVASIPIVYGEHVRNWWNSDNGQPVRRGTLAWTGTNPEAKRFNTSLRLYLLAWENARPRTEVVSIDYVSTLTTAAAPFCVAMTAEEPAGEGAPPAPAAKPN